MKQISLKVAYVKHNLQVYSRSSYMKFIMLRHKIRKTYRKNTNSETQGAQKAAWVAFNLGQGLLFEPRISPGFDPEIPYTYSWRCKGKHTHIFNTT